MNYPDQKGFTLIEALIAFLVLSVGIVGALLFHATLLAQSGDNKARLEAISVAENWAEEERNKAYTTAASFAAAMSGLSSLSSSTSGELNDYTLSVVSVSSPSTNVYKVDYQVSWDSGSVKLSSFFGWLDTSDLVDPTKVGDGSGDEYDNPDLPLPSGTLSEVPRIQVASAALVNANLVDARSNETVKVYQDGDDYKVAVEVEEGVYVQLAELTNVDNEIFTITGRIYLNQGDYSVERGFGKVYGAASVDALLVEGEVSGDLTANDDYYTYTEDGEPRYFRNNVIDVRASAGANCVIGRFKNGDAVTSRIRGREYTVYYGTYGDYICVAGSGWNGTVKPYFRNYDGNDLADIVIGDLNCAPSVRSFRYYIVETSNLPGLEAKASFASWAASESVASILSSTSSAIVGQSGLVRFYTDEAQRNAAASAEGVLWGQYFWHNPNYLINPSFTGGYFSETPTVLGPDLLSGKSYAYEGYQAPLVSSVASRSYEVAQPGDVSHQNFYISASGSGGGALADCNELLDYIVETGSPIVSDLDPFTEALGANGFEYHSHLVSSGVPGYEVDGTNRGYLPQSASHQFVASDFNRSTVSGDPENTGTIILGFTLATDSVGGTITIPSGASYSSDIVIAGNPEPVISITCSVDPDTLDTEIVSGALTYDYSCGVPVTWSGEIFSYPESTAGLSRCTTFTGDDNPPVYIGSFSNDVNVSDIESNATEYPSAWYYYQNVVSAATSGSSIVSGALFEPLEFYDVLDATNATNLNFCFE